MKKLILLTCINCFAILFAGVLNANHLTDQLQFSVRMTGAQQTPAVITDAIGIGSFILSNDRSAVDINLTIANLSGSIQAIHIHEGFAGEAGGVWMDLEPFLIGNRVKGQITGLTPEQLSRMLKGGYYVNVHTMENPDGEARGQISLENDQAYTAMLDGSQEVPAVDGSASGIASFIVSKTGYSAQIELIATEMSGQIMGAHIHRGAAGENGDVLIDLTPLINGNRIFGEIDFTALEAMDVEALKTGGLYLNLHTADNMGGEIRGQLMIQEGLSFDAFLSGMNEVPMAITNARGVAVMNLNPTLDTLNYAFLIDGLSGDAQAAHIHYGAAGENGDVAVGLMLTDGKSASGFITGASITNDLVNAILRGETYLNVHTVLFPNGEVRAQALRHAREGFGFDLCGAQEVPAIIVDAYGSAVISYDRNRSNIHYMVASSDVSDMVMGAHLHLGEAGTNGDVAINFSDNLINNTTSGYDTTLTAELATLIINGGTYVNLHTMNFPGGELRGQVLKTGSCEIVTSIATSAQSNNLSIYPNPLVNQLNISSDQEIELVNIFSTEGRLVRSIPANSSNQVSISLSDLARGVYIVQTSTEGVISTNRVIKN
ncbi:MAG: CHRD domain-containing protein [Bacteroidia bacterium]